MTQRQFNPIRSSSFLSRSPPFLFDPRSTSAIRTISTLTHLDCEGRASMVDIANKHSTQRIATASGRIYIPHLAYDLVTSSYPTSGGSKTSSPEENAKQKARRKGDALTVAQLAAIMGAKKTSDLIPLCHPLSLTHVAVNFTPETSEEHGARRHFILCEATVSTEGKTGVEMEALTAVSVGLLTVWDMLKAVAGREMEIGEIVVSRKAGGRSGDFVRQV